MKSISDNTRQIVWNKYGKMCAYCGIQLSLKDMQVDHIAPKFRRTTATHLARYGLKKGPCKLENYNPSCATCNSSKSTWTIEEWRVEIKSKQDKLRLESSFFRILEKFNLVQLVDSDVQFHFEKH